MTEKMIDWSEVNSDNIRDIRVESERAYVHQRNTERPGTSS